MDRFLEFFDRWADADQAAIRAECRLSRLLDMYCDGMGPAPSLEVIAEARELRAVANSRLRLLWAMTRKARACLPII
jgi:hypothetical protein